MKILFYYEKLSKNYDQNLSEEFIYFILCLMSKKG